MGQQLEHILYVEDEPDIQAVARLALEHLGGFNVEVCSSGNEALSKIANYTPDLILLDVMMPGMDGPTTLAELRKTAVCTTTPVVFMTAKVQPQEVAHYLSLGAIDVIPKPFDPMTLADKVRSIWDNRNDR
ncbi:MAG: response regulator [Gammaproteobacteria bacterium]|nr:response regulator [Gammaproteobacteria bacterium]MBU2477906.1 response regulator [Gammaproteobacteria bacterium]